MQNYWAQMMAQNQPQNTGIVPPHMQGQQMHPHVAEMLRRGLPVFGQRQNQGPIPMPKPQPNFGQPMPMPKPQPNFGIPMPKPRPNPIPMPKPPIFSGQNRPWDEQPFDPRFGFRPGP